MLNLLLNLVAVAGFAWFVIVVHEYGHLLVGRLGGVPGGEIRVDLAGRPPHVALRQGAEWLSPDDPAYAEVFQSHCPRTLCAWAFVAGGFLVESVVSLTGVLAFALLGADSMAFLLGWTTLAIFIAYLALDLVLTTKARTPYGDVSALWQIHAPATVLFVLATTAVKITSIGAVF